MKNDNAIFEERVPNFTSYVNENYPAGAAEHPDAPWKKADDNKWEITGVSYDPENGDIVFAVTGDGYPEEVRVWSGDNSVIETIDKNLDMTEDEFDVALEDLVSKMKEDIGGIPEKIMTHVERELADVYDAAQAQNAGKETAAQDAFQRTSDEQ